MKQYRKQTGLNLPSELRWRISILSALVITVPLLSQSGVPENASPVAVADAAPAARQKGLGMAGMLPGVSPITFGRTPSASFDTQS